MSTRATKTNQIRIIGGEWRGRKIVFPDVEGLRPTGDRIRETVFNWLQADIAGARCLDLFAGSGALGFEAASRKAAEVVMVEKDNGVFHCLMQSKKQLNAENITLKHMDGLTLLGAVEKPFDVVFLDPPFQSGLLESSVKLLLQSSCLHAHSRIYVETDSQYAFSPPDQWVLLKEKKTGNVRYYLIGIK